MFDTNRLRSYISDLFNQGDDGKPASLNHEDFETLAGLIEQAADELDAARASNLVEYRKMAMTQVSWKHGLTPSGDRELNRSANLAEQIAHAMLAAERPPNVEAIREQIGDWRDSAMRVEQGSDVQLEILQAGGAREAFDRVLDLLNGKPPIKRTPSSSTSAVATPPQSMPSPAAQAIVDAWNAQVPVGTRVRFRFTPSEEPAYLKLGFKQGQEDVTSSAAYLYRGRGAESTPAVHLAGSTGPWALSRLQVVNDSNPKG